MNEGDIVSQQPFREMELRDEAQILAEMEGKYLDEFVYQIKQGNRTVTGLSKAGVFEIAYRMGNIKVNLVKLEDTGDQYLVVCEATDSERGNTRLGVSTQSKTLKRRDGSEEPDKFALQKAMSKAQRNAMRALMPEEMLKVWIETFLGLKTGNPERQPPKTAPATVSEGHGAPYPEIGHKLRQSGLDPGMLQIYEYGKKTHITPLEELGPDWHAYDEVLAPLGAKWIEDPGRWEIDQ